MAQQPKANKKLAGMIDYMLGRSPGEFGLVPDENGYVKVKELLKALHEEDGWRHVRQAQLREVMLTVPQVPFEMDETVIRAKDRQHLQAPKIAESLPGALFTCIRRRAWPRVAERGLTPTDERPVILSSDRGMALRIGRRQDADPVTLEVSVEQAEQLGVVFQQAGGTLFLADFIPHGSFSGPALPKEKSAPKKKAAPADQPVKGTRNQAGTFALELPVTPDAEKKKRRKKDPDWKRDRAKNRRNKQKGWPDL